MFQRIFNAFLFFKRLWNHLPKKTQDKIIDSVADAFEDLFRSYFRKSQRRYHSLEPNDQQ